MRVYRLPSIPVPSRQGRAIRAHADGRTHTGRCGVRRERTSAAACVDASALAAWPRSHCRDPREPLEDLVGPDFRRHDTPLLSPRRTPGPTKSTSAAREYPTLVAMTLIKPV